MLSYSYSSYGTNLSNPVASESGGSYIVNPLYNSTKSSLLSRLGKPKKQKIGFDIDSLMKLFGGKNG